MFTGLLILIGAVLGLMVLGGGLYVTYQMLTDSYMEGKVIGAFLGLCLLAGVVFIGGVAAGELSLEDAVPDGCYQVINDTNFVPAGKTFFVYNDRHYIDIPCPGQSIR